MVSGIERNGERLAARITDVTQSSDRAATTLPRVLGPVQALSVVVGSVIGSGIFIVPATVAQEVPSIVVIAVIWIVAGLFSLAGALTLAELAAMLPRAGGPYVYLKEAFGAPLAFLFGWTEFLVIRAGSVATLAAAFSLYFAQLVPAPAGMDSRVWQMFVAVGAIAIVAAINIVGTVIGGGVQVFGTIVKVGALVLMILLPFALGKASIGRLAPVWPQSFDAKLFHGIMGAMVGVLWAYDGWVNASSLAEEIQDPGRNVPRALMHGMAILIVVYVTMTLVYHAVLPMDVIRAAATEKGSPRVVAADFCSTLIGPAGISAISLVVMFSTFIALNGNALSGPRAYFAMARDGLFPHALCRIHPRFQTPANAILAQAIWSIALTVAATLFLLRPPPASGLPNWLQHAWSILHETPLYNVLYSYVIFGGTVIYSLTISSVFVLRMRRPDLARPYKTWGYPLTPLLYLAASILLMYSMLAQKESRIASLSGLSIVLLGLPAYWFFRTQTRTASKSAS